MVGLWNIHAQNFCFYAYLTWVDMGYSNMWFCSLTGAYAVAPFSKCITLVCVMWTLPSTFMVLIPIGCFCSISIFIPAESLVPEWILTIPNLQHVLSFIVVTVTIFVVFDQHDLLLSEQEHLKEGWAWNLVDMDFDDSTSFKIYSRKRLLLTSCPLPLFIYFFSRQSWNV